MFRVLQLIIYMLGAMSVVAQTNSSWNAYYSYNNVVDVTEAQNQIIAATENVLFVRDLTDYNLFTINSIDGLKTEQITAIYHSKGYNKTLIGNSNGLLIIIDGNDNNKIINKVDIVNDISNVQNLKKINHFTEHQDKIYIATDYGITVFNLQNLEFGDTYYIGSSGTNTPVLATTIHQNTIYAITQNQGVKQGNLSNPFLIHYNSWDTFYTGNIQQIASVGEHLIGSYENTLYRFTNNGEANILTTTMGSVEDLRFANDYLTVTTSNLVYVYNAQLGQIITIGQDYVPTSYTNAIVKNEKLYVGTQTHGVLEVAINNASSYQLHIPAGPQRNKVYRVNATANALWCVFGDNSYFYNPYNPILGKYGISKLTTEGWKHIYYSELNQATNLSDVVVDFANPNVAYVASNHSGILMLEHDQVSMLYNASNTGQNGLEGYSQDLSNDVRVHNIAMDKNKNLWATNAGYGGNLKVKRNSGEWESYDIVLGEVNYGDLIIDKNNTKWLATNNRGLIGFNENHQNRKINITTYEGGIPYNHVYSVAVDKSNRLWIGTTWGLRVLPTVDRFMTDDTPKVNPIIIIEDGLAQELLYRQTVSKIKVDGADRKWLGTLGAGVFLVSPNGQETIYHFTKENSPLPSNNIIDIDINPQTGEVFFATDKGMVAFKGMATEALSNLANVYVYPNPVRPEYNGTVKITGLTDQANVKITDISGNLVFEVNSKGGTVEWDTTAFGKYKVASGVYMIFVTTKDASETKTKKVMIVR
ncbi:MAG: two-component regulator propeller domain-containing protein [Bacteroidota bacterium]|nr:two-component regulator propeller domain-containing protein [Bacteroidota bacterium]